MNLSSLINQLESVFDYSLHYASQHHYLKGCTKFWVFFYLSSSFIVLIISILISYRIYKENSTLKNYVKQKNQHEALQIDTLQKHA